jgi:hypothetical protein
MGDEDYGLQELEDEIERDEDQALTNGAHDA